MDIHLPPIVPKDSPSFSAFIADALRVIVDALRGVSAQRSGTAIVTGSLTVTTGLTKVSNVSAIISDNITSGRAYANAQIGATPGTIVLKVWDSAFAASVVATNVHWTAYGF